MPSHPGDLVQQDDGFPPIIEALAEQAERLRPGIGNDAGAQRLGAQAFSEIAELVGVRLPLAGSEPLDDEQFHPIPPREFAEERRLSDAPPPATRDQRCRRLAKKQPERFQFLFTT